MKNKKVRIKKVVCCLKSIFDLIDTPPPNPFPLFFEMNRKVSALPTGLCFLSSLKWQEVSDNSHLVVGQNSHLKNFKPESERKKLDLPVQKNLLTKYFCIQWSPLVDLTIFLYNRMSLNIYVTQCHTIASDFLSNKVLLWLVNLCE